MAGPVVHNKFFSDCLSESNLSSGIFLNNQNLYAQGHDLLLYMQTWNFIHNRQLSLILSNFNFQEFVNNYLESAIRNNSIYLDNNIKMFLYGYISHHILDSFFHPFIMHYAHDYLPVRGKAWEHGKIEALYDTEFIVKYRCTEAKKYKIHRDFTYKDVLSPDFIENIEKTIEKTYHINNGGKKINIALHSTAGHLKLYRYDPYHLKKNFAKLTEPIVRIGSYEFFYDESQLNELEQYKNLEREMWVNEHTHEHFNYSFDDIYRTARNATIFSFIELDRMIEAGCIDIEKIKKVIPNRSAITGDICGKTLSYIKYKGE